MAKEHDLAMSRAILTLRRGIERRNPRVWPGPEVRDLCDFLSLRELHKPQRSSKYLLAVVRKRRG